ncbi:hypothetical protein HPB48_008594 [Haemaphysalis longicornis]|uniref:Uncharacterized protein n=1 Tax=Haemaphysalis longicornis TaxID=44386 RepID=A0A9J6GG03_HAELO|nr:hypothetical protein HPB48_008594 [Haemaphysalis longicornis]
MDDLTAATQSSPPKQVTEEAQSRLESALISWESNGDVSDDCYPTIADSGLSCHRPRNAEGLTEVVTSVNSGSSVSCAPRSSDEGKLPLGSTCPATVPRQEPDIYLGSPRHQITASFHSSESGIGTELRELHDFPSTGVGGYPTDFPENTCRSQKDALPNEGGDDEKLAGRAPHIDVFKHSVDGHFGGQGEVLGLGATAVFPVRQDLFNQGQYPKFTTQDSARASRMGAYIQQERLRRSLSRAAKIERGKKGPPDIRLVNDIFDNLIEEFEPRQNFCAPLRQVPSLGPLPSALPLPRGRTPGATLSTPLLRSERDGRLSSSLSAALRARHEASPTDKALDTNKAIQRVNTACSLLESATGELTKAARRLCQSQPQFLTSQRTGQTGSVGVVSQQESEPESKETPLDERGSPAEIDASEWMLEQKARKAELEGQGATKAPESEVLALRPQLSHLQKNLKRGEEICTCDISRPEPERMFKRIATKSRTSRMRAEMPEGERIPQLLARIVSEKNVKHGKGYDHGEAGLEDSVDRVPTALDTSDAPALKEDNDSAGVNRQTPRKNPLTDMSAPALTKRAVAEKRPKKLRKSHLPTRQEHVSRIRQLLHAKASEVQGRQLHAVVSLVEKRLVPGKSSLQDSPPNLLSYLLLRKVQGKCFQRTPKWLHNTVEAITQSLKEYPSKIVARNSHSVAKLRNRTKQVYGRLVRRELLVVLKREKLARQRSHSMNLLPLKDAKKRFLARRNRLILLRAMVLHCPNPVRPIR